jgi:cell division GTPase FtsZ
MTLGEVTQAAELMLRIAPNNGRIIWGAKVDEAMAGHVKVRECYENNNSNALFTSSISPK